MKTAPSRTKKEHDQGFTLIELLVVLIIIGVLAAIAIPVFMNQRTKAVDSSTKSDMKNLVTAIETVSADDPSATTNVFTASALANAGWVRNPDNYFNILGSPATGYCVMGWNPKTGSRGLTGAPSYVYDSLDGGFAPAGFNLATPNPTWGKVCTLPALQAGPLTTFR